jgi:hypothetical protein
MLLLYAWSCGIAVDDVNLLLQPRLLTKLPTRPWARRTSWRLRRSGPASTRRASPTCASTLLWAACSRSTPTHAPPAGRRHPLPARPAALPAQCGQGDRHHLQHAHVAGPRLPLPGQPDLPNKHPERCDREVLRRGRRHREEDHGLRSPSVQWFNLVQCSLVPDSHQMWMTLIIMLCAHAESSIN